MGPCSLNSSSNQMPVCREASQLEGLLYYNHVRSDTLQRCKGNPVLPSQSICTDDSPYTSTRGCTD